MPRAKAKSSEGLSITLKDNQAFYSPGNQVTGDVTLNTSQDFAIGSVNVELYGRVKGKHFTYQSASILANLEYSAFHAVAWPWRESLAWPCATFLTKGHTL